MEIRNLMENSVRTLVDELFAIEEREKHIGFCTCDQCRLDVSCFVLNRVKPEYIVSSRGLAYSEKEGLDKVQRRADIITLIREGWGKVSHAPRLTADHLSGRALAPLPLGPVYNYPTIMGRVFDGRTFAPLGEGNVRLLADGEDVPMIDPNWSNPFILATGTAGTYIFWPRPETCSDMNKQKSVTFEILVDVPGLERLSHFIEQILIPDHEARADFSLQHVSKVPDLYLFPEGQAEQNW
ncbi:MAG: late competence development ComFB family protein [Spirochaetaceae bacterium]|nr:late competence development ComFB family protein [Spirochaetaceae bacterium]